MKIKVLSRDAFNKNEEKEKYIAISITDPTSEKINPIVKPLYMLSLQFHDAEGSLVKREDCKRCNGTGFLPEYKDINDGHCYLCTKKLDIKLFTDQQADQILRFIDKYSKDVDLIVVHCEAGISRSSGIAGALSLLINGSDEYYFKKYIPNMFVYRKILNMYMRN